MRSVVQPWYAIVARLEIVIAGVGQAGLNPTVAIQRLSDNQWLQAGGGSWGAGFAVNNMVQIDAANQPGMYEYAPPGARLDYSASKPGYRLKYAEAGTPITEYEYLKVEGEFSGELGTGLATAGAGNTVTFNAWAPGVANLWTDMLVTIVDGTGKGQTRVIMGYSAGRVATVTPNWTTNPDATSVCVVHAGAQADVGLWKTATVSPPTAAGNIKGDLEEWRAVVPANLNGGGTVQADVELWRNVLPDALSGGKVEADVQQWRGVVPSVLSGANNVKADVEEWKGAVPNNLIAGRVDADVGNVQVAVRNAIAGQVWEELRAGHNAAGSFGEGIRLFALAAVGAGATAWNELGHAVWRRNATTGVFGAAPTGAEPDWLAGGVLQPEWTSTMLMSLIGATIRGGVDTSIQVADNAHAGGTRFYVGPGAIPDGSSTEWVGSYAVYIPAGASGKRPLDGIGNGNRATALVKVTNVGVDGTGNFVDVTQALSGLPLGHGGIAVGDWLIGIHTQSVGTALDVWQSDMEALNGGSGGFMLPATDSKRQRSAAGLLQAINESRIQGFRNSTASEWDNLFVASANGTTAKFYYTPATGPAVVSSPDWAGKLAVWIVAATGRRRLVKVTAVATDGSVHFALTLPDGSVLPAATSINDRLVVLQATSLTVGDIFTQSMSAYETAGTFGNHINRMLRLRQENMRVVYTAWSTHGQPTAGYVLLYSSSADLATDVDPWALAKARYDFTATYNTDLQLTGYESARTL